MQPSKLQKNNCMEQMPEFDVVIVGAGVAGLSAAIHLQNEGLNVKVLEADDAVGGRMRTDKVEGFWLDRGFQVLLTSYPEVQRMLDYDSLELKHFYPGALIYYKENIHRLADPFRKPIESLNSFFSPISNWGDKLKILALRNRHKRLSIEELFQQPEKTTLSYLREWNFSPQIIERFFRPFLGGVFLENKLTTSSRMFEFVLKMFTEGYAALPSEGMKAIPEQLAAQLMEGTIALNTPVKKVEKGKVLLESGEILTAKLVLVATNAPTATQLIDGYETNTEMRSTHCLYYATDLPPIKEPALVLNGESKGWVNHLCFPSVVNPNYAPPGRYLVSVNVIKDTGDLTQEELLTLVTQELKQWFKTEVRYWDHLKTYTIRQALPVNDSVEIPDKNNIKAVQKGIYVCGDHTYNASINGAMESARYTANAISWDLALNGEYSN